MKATMGLRKATSTFVAALALGTACATGGDPAPVMIARAWTSETRNAGDTVVVRTSGVRDSQARLLLREEITIGGRDAAAAELFSSVHRVRPLADDAVLILEGNSSGNPTQAKLFDKDGVFVRDIGRRGTGPGEYPVLDGAAAAPDGKILLWTRRGINLYSASGEFRSTVPAESMRGQFVNAEGVIFTEATIDDPDLPDSIVHATGRRAQRNAAIRMKLNGEVIDTLVAPRAQDLRQTTIPLTTGAFANYLAIPYVPQFHAALSPFGHYVSGNGEKLVLTSRSSSGHPLIIESDRLALKIDERERQSHYRNLRQKTDAISLDDIPREKPVFKGLRVDDDGRIWVWLYAASALVPVSDTAAAAAAGASLERWTEPAPVFDVFSAAGEFLGTVELPESSTFAAARGSRVWAIVTDNMDVPRVVRYRVDGLAEGAR